MRLPLTLPPPNHRDFDVVALGECSIDLVGIGPINETAKDKISLSRFEVFPGGQAATVAVACARLGHRARFIGSAGDDQWGRQVIESLSREGVDAAVEVHAGANSRVALILVSAGTGDRRVFEYRDAKLAVSQGEALAALVSAGRLLMVDATDPVAAEAAATARRLGIPTLSDVDRLGPAAERVLRQTDVIVVSEPFAEAYGAASGGGIGAGLAAIHEAFRPAVAVATLGAKGSLARCDGQEIRTPGFKVDVEDTTGAGDAFRAGFLAGWLAEGDGADLGTVLEYANAAGALNCRALGAQTALPTRRELTAYLTNTGRGQSN